MRINEQIEILTAVLEGKPLEYYGELSEQWFPYYGDSPNLGCGRWRIKPEEPKPKIADGHNPDRLTEDQVGVKDGWRLLSEKEKCSLRDANVLRADVDLWLNGYKNWQRGSSGGVPDFSYRTQKPPGYFDNGVPMKKVALTLEDFPLGCQLRTGTMDGVITVRNSGCSGIHVMGNDYSLSAFCLHEYSHWQRSLDGGKTWLPCYKEVPETE